jgi:hypothetical protein
MSAEQWWALALLVFAPSLGCLITYYLTPKDHR